MSLPTVLPTFSPTPLPTNSSTQEQRYSLGTMMAVGSAFCFIALIFSGILFGIYKAWQGSGQTHDVEMNEVTPTEEQTWMEYIWGMLDWDDSSDEEILNATSERQMNRIIRRQRRNTRRNV